MGAAAIPVVAPAPSRLPHHDQLGRRLEWFSIFLAWLIKVIVLKYGGAAVFTRSRDFFLGLIVGRMFISGGWLVVDYLTGTVGNPIFWI